MRIGPAASGKSSYSSTGEGGFVVTELEHSFFCVSPGEGIVYFESGMYSGALEAMTRVLGLLALQ